MIFKCKICGGNLEIQGNNKIITCEYCGTKQTLPKLENDKIANLYDRANHFRRNNEYDKAEAIYEMILNEDSKDAEAYWSIVLCEFGVEYVEDPKTHEYIPTCNRAQNVSILTNENYKQALKYANSEQKQLYKTDAEKINKIQKRILEISNKEEPFDVFICYKETDENGKRTQDSIIAQELYYHLQKEGFKVFFAKITLEDKIGESYEPYIFAALNSAKVMLVLGTKKEYFDAIWVKNEWSRYLALIKNGEEKTLIPCYKDMDAYDLPEEFAYLQSQDMSKLGFEQDLVHGIKKFVNVNDKKKKSKKTVLKIVIAIIFIIALAIAAISYKMYLDNGNKETSNENSSQQQSQILRPEIMSMSGYSFNITVDELKNKLMDSVNLNLSKYEIQSKEMEIPEEDGVWGVGWFTEDYDTGLETVIGIQIFTDDGEHVSSISCVPDKYGSGDPTPLTIPVNIYEEAKKILGSETQEWKDLVDSGTIKETTYDVYNNTEVTDGSFYCGMRKDLTLNRK